ncbi:hypothetical protein Aspvir_005017 [Aspergillus viridinutans]|uniref:Phenylalanine ammonia-lyase n=1 Tax=Aspergillus viridinutans TaxID=75553 RepID=A0A9P3F0V3_ASPVI|nr:uncharacterized protein Aspvir_005017 [Aspergillus viridinutans]GIK00987.1 hypothetical protein Aspvir_005017 [Aspergillus viridinutans]
MATLARMFTDLVLSQRCHPSSTLAVSGRDLTISDVVAVSRHLAHVELTPASIDAIEACSKIVPEKIAQGEVIYGVNTGFGGSADARSNDVERVQQSLISHLTCGIVADGKQELALTSNGIQSKVMGIRAKATGIQAKAMAIQAKAMAIQAKATAPTMAN